jgi:MG2 domain.
MPYAGSSASTSVTVTKVDVTLSTDRTYVTPGDRVTMTAKVTINGSPLSGVNVSFYFVDSFMLYLTSKSTDATGTASVVYTVPWDVGGTVLPCKRGYLQAKVEYAGASYWSNKVDFVVAYPTRLSISTDKSTYAPGETVTVSVKLEYNDRDTWKPLANQTVTITAFDTSRTVTTGSDGTAKTTFTAPQQTGTYTIAASYGGTLAAPALGLTTRDAVVAALTLLPLLLSTGAMLVSMARG